MTTRTAVLGSAATLAVAAAVLAARHAEVADSSPPQFTAAWSTVWTVAVVAAFAAYAAAVLLLRNGARLRLALAVGVVLQLLPLLGPTLLSRDVAAYWSQARVLVVHGADPYDAPPSAFPDDPSFLHVSESWRGQTAEYPPLWELAATVPASIGGRSAHRAELAFRAVAALGILAATVLLARRRLTWGVVVLAWNPLLALHFAGGGHNDAWLAPLFVIACAGATAGAGAAVSAATFLKGVPALLVPLELARTRLRPGRGYLVALVGVAALLAAAAFGVFGTAWLTASNGAATRESGLGGVHWLTELGLRHRYAVAAGAVAFALVYAALLRDAWRTGRARRSLSMTALCLTMAQLRPWYAVWGVALAAAEVDTAAVAAAVGLSGYLLLADAVSL